MHIVEELFYLSSETLCLSEATKVINEISVNLPLQLLISKITTSLNDIFKQIIMNRRTEVKKFGLEPTFERLLMRSKIII